jgi:hypothetical protein
MKRQFKVTVKRELDDYIARCSDFPDMVIHGSSLKDATEKIRAAIIKRLEDGSDSGTAPKPHPVSPPPFDPTILVEALYENPDA